MNATRKRCRRQMPSRMPDFLILLRLALFSLSRSVKIGSLVSAKFSGYQSRQHIGSSFFSLMALVKSIFRWRHLRPKSP